MYGEFLLQMEKDNSTEIFERLNASKDDGERAFSEYVLRLEAHVDLKAFARATVKEENGVFTKHGYLADRGEFKEVYRGPQDIPDEYRLFSHAMPEIALEAGPPDKPAEKESVMAKIREAREAAKNAPAPSPQERGVHKKSYEPEV